MTEFEAYPIIDLVELDRLNNWLLAFFSGFWISFIALMILVNQTDNGGSTIVQILILTWSFCSWGYLITLGRMAARLKKSWLTWVGLTMIFNLLGILISYPWMQNEIKKYRNNRVRIRHGRAE